MLFSKPASIGEAFLLAALVVFDAACDSDDSWGASNDTGASGDGAGDTTGGADSGGDPGDTTAGGDGAVGGGGGMIGSEGGTIASGEASASIPPGALAAETALEITEVSAPVPLPEDFEAVGSVFAFQPHGTIFLQPVTLSLPYSGDADELAVLRLDDESDTAWEEVSGATFEEGLATLQTTGFSFYVVAGSGGGGGAGTLVDEALSTCVWTTACLNTEDSYGGAAPNTNVGSCIATFVDQHSDAELAEPWDEFRDCVDANPSGCGAFRQCLLDIEAICVVPVMPIEDDDWTEGGRCADGSRSCTDTTCGPQPCAGSDSYTCSGDSLSLQSCETGVSRTQPCSRSGLPGACATEGPTDTCVPGYIGSCGAESISCAGSVLSFCFRGFEAEVDCAALDQTCTTSGCEEGTECTYFDDGCTGNTLRTCVSGHAYDVDCAALGGTCGQVRGAAFACVLPP